MECRRLTDFDDAAKLKMCVLTDSGTDRMAGGRCKKISRQQPCCIKGRASGITCRRYYDAIISIANTQLFCKICTCSDQGSNATILLCIHIECSVPLECRIVVAVKLQGALFVIRGLSDAFNRSLHQNGPPHLAKSHTHRGLMSQSSPCPNPSEYGPKLCL